MNEIFINFINMILKNFQKNKIFKKNKILKKIKFSKKK